MICHIYVTATVLTVLYLDYRKFTAYSLHSKVMFVCWGRYTELNQSSHHHCCLSLVCTTRAWGIRTIVTYWITISVILLNVFMKVILLWLHGEMCQKSDENLLKNLTSMNVDKVTGLSNLLMSIFWVFFLLSYSRWTKIRNSTGQYLIFTVIKCFLSKSSPQLLVTRDTFCIVCIVMKELKFESDECFIIAVELLCVFHLRKRK